MKRKLKFLGKWMEKREEGIGTVGEDFNTRTGEEEGRVGLEGGDKEGLEKRSMDKKIRKRRD